MANTIVPSGVQVAPRGAPCTRQIVNAGPPDTGTFLSSWPEKKPIHAPSGEKNGARTSSDSVSTPRAFRSPIGRTYSCVPVWLAPRYAIRLPSGERTTLRSLPDMPRPNPPGTVSAKREGIRGRSCGCRRKPAASARTAPAATPRKRAAANPRRENHVCASCAVEACGNADVSSRRKPATAMSRILAWRSLTRQRLASSTTCWGTAAGIALQSGSPRTTAAIVSVTSSPSNARRPVSISYSTQLNAQMSLRLSAIFPFACSGLM